MSFLLDVVAGVVASAISVAVGRVLSGARLRTPRLIGWINLAYLRTTAAGVVGISLSAGIGLSTSDHSHRTVSYVFWYGVAALAFAVVIAATVVIDRAARRTEKPRIAVGRGKSRVRVLTDTRSTAFRPVPGFPGTGTTQQRKAAVEKMLSSERIRERDDAEQHERSSQEMSALIRRQFHELKGEQTARETIPPEHRQELRDLLSGAITALEGEQQFHYNEVPALTRANRDIFTAHFAKAAERLDAWNQVLFDRDSPFGLLGNRIVREAQARGFNEPGVYWQNEVARLTQDVTSTRLRKGIPGPQVGQLVEWEQRIDGFGPTLHANGHRIATAQHDSGNVLQRKRVAVERWLDEVQSWAEVDAIAEAERRFALYTDRQDLLAELRKLAKIEHLPNAGGCEVCRGNRGDLD